MHKDLLYFVIGVFISYLIGSFPTAYILGRILKRIDIRKFGSGNVGATNAFRILGRTAGISVLIIDILKGIIPVVFISEFIIYHIPFLTPEIIRIILGLTAVLGHNWTIFLNFKGGKGVATSLGVLIGLGIKISNFSYVLFGLVSVWLLALLISRMVSLASILAALALPGFMSLFIKSKDLIMISLFFSLFMILRHKSNIQRILQGREPRI